MTTRLPEGFSLRPPTFADLEAVTALINAASLADLGPGSMQMTPQFLRLLWSDPVRDLAQDDLVVVAPDGQLAAHAMVHRWEPWTTYEFDARTHPAYVGRGLGGALLEAVEARARRDVERAPAGARVVLQGQAFTSNPRGQALLTARGFAPIRAWRTMEIALDTLPATPIAPPPGIAIRALRRGVDERAVWEVSEAAFEDHWNNDPRPFEDFAHFFFEGAPDDFYPDLWQLAWAGDDVVAAAICRVMHADGGDMGWVSSLGTRREWRGRGIGSALLDAAFRAFRARGFQRAGLDVDGSSLTGADRVYERAGMHVAHEATVFEKELRPGSD